MPFKIALRETLSESFFKRYLHIMAEFKGSASTPVGEVWIASGYFSAALVMSEPHHLTKRSLPAALAAGCAKARVFADRKHVATTGGSHSRALRNFVDKLTVPHRLYENKANVWHAKVALRIIDDEVIAALVGSSNATGPPYSEKTKFDWNHECDVLLWLDRPELNEVFAAPVTNGVSDGTSEILGQVVGSAADIAGAKSIPRDTLERQLKALRFRLKGQTTKVSLPLPPAL